MVEYRAFQLDLARQMETLPNIRRYLRLGASCGMNAAVLYLEDRIKTPSYPYADDADAYSMQDMREIVAYAQTLGLTLIPVVSNLGHAERFLRHEALKGLAEGASSGVVCTQNPETYAFFDAYLAEVASLFPGQFFHTGLDEVWGMAACPICSAMPPEKVFLDHIRHTHELLSRLGKTMLMWDDMLECFPGLAAQLPRDIVLCSWNYGYVADYPEGHFDNCRRDDLFEEYDRLGLRYFACPTAYLNNIDNIDSLTAYAQKHHPLGMLLTIWELQTRQMLSLEPVIRYAGKKWSQQPIALSEAVLQTVPCTRKYADAVAASMHLNTNAIPHVDVDYQEQGSADFYNRQAMMRFLLSCLEAEREGVPWAYHAAFTYSLRLGLLNCRLMENPADCAAEIESLRDEQMALWAHCRAGLPNDGLARFWENLRAKCARLTEMPPLENYLLVRFCLPDHCSSPYTLLTLTYEDGTTEQFSGRYKSHNGASCRNVFFSCRFRLNRAAKPCQLSIEVKDGGGGTGIAYAEAVVQGRRYRPTHAPAELMQDDTQFVFIGDKRYHAPFIQPAAPGGHLEIMF